MAVMEKKVSVRLTDKQYLQIAKAAKKNKLSIAEHIRSCII